MEQNQLKEITIPLLIKLGISGHRKVEQLGDIVQLKEKLKEEFRSVRDEYKKHNGALNFLIFSPLAEGADRLFVDSIWEEEPNAKLIVPLPFKQEDYIKAFSSDEARDVFFSYTNHPNCLETFVVSHSSKDEYMNVGKYIVDNTDYVFFLYSGSSKNIMDGGTGSIIEYTTFKLTINEEKNKRIISPLYSIFCTKTGDIFRNTEPIEKRIKNKRKEKISPFLNRYKSYLSCIKYKCSGENKNAKNTIKSFSDQNIFDWKANSYQKQFSLQSTLIIILAMCISILVFSDWASGGNHVFDGLGIIKLFLNWDILVFSGLIIIVFLANKFKKSKSLSHWIVNRYLAERIRHMAALLTANISFSRILYKSIHDPSTKHVLDIWHSIYYYFFCKSLKNNSPELSPEEIRDLLINRESDSPLNVLYKQFCWHKKHIKEKSSTHFLFRNFKILFFILSCSASGIAAFIVALNIETVSMANLLDVISSFSSVFLATTVTISHIKEHKKVAIAYEYSCEKLQQIYRDVFFCIYDNKTIQKQELQWLLFYTIEVLMYTTYNWMYTLQEKDPDWV